MVHDTSPGYVPTTVQGAPQHPSQGALVVLQGAASTYRGPGRVRCNCQQGVTPPTPPTLSRAAREPAPEPPVVEADAEARELQASRGRYFVIKCRYPLNVLKDTYDHRC